ncbi:hypothetical protein EV143_10283 [Flavobacterium chryseum]|uniref:hypothetical protein n=1 Tax=Flavobacterium sp. P3160 TaxID=2512113 RepID=UPI001060194B|nr:hypothetical protein [Flavobacterium sp. P3160]TDO82823.1 hypothetical protein EV143_10283 [Flavobacterium sp. P3160]
MDLSNWQKKLLPFLVISISTLGIIFIIFYFIQINDIEKALENVPEFQSSSINKNQTINRWNDLKDLERFSISNRYYNARLIIRSRFLMISLSFLTGVVLCFVGSIFILGKISEDPTTIEGSQEKINLKIVSSSPGIILSFLGIIIIITSILSKVELNVSDSPLFIPETTINIDREILDTMSYQIDTTKKKEIDDIILKYKK